MTTDAPAPSCEIDGAAYYVCSTGCASTFDTDRARCMT
jgi:YHS domain-containing protein